MDNTASLKLPTFLIIGAMKGGTTSLHRYLASHEQIFMPHERSINYFSRNWIRGVEWYASHFGDTDRELRGEVSPSYSKMPVEPPCAERIASLIPDCKLIYLVRDPFQRAVSDYIHGVLAGRISRPFSDVVTAESRIVQTSRYAFQLEPYMRQFPPEQALVVASEELRENRVATVSRILEFLGADPGLMKNDLIENTFHQTQNKLGRRHWSPSLRKIRASEMARAFFRSLPGPVRRVLVRIGTRPPSAVASLLSSVPESVPPQLARIFAEECKCLRGLIDTSAIPWIEAYE